MVVIIYQIVCCSLKFSQDLWLHYVWVVVACPIMWVFREQYNIVDKDPFMLVMVYLVCVAKILLLLAWLWFNVVAADYFFVVNCFLIFTVSLSFTLPRRNLIASLFRCSLNHIIPWKFHSKKELVRNFVSLLEQELI